MKDKKKIEDFETELKGLGQVIHRRLYQLGLAGEGFEVQAGTVMGTFVLIAADTSDLAEIKEILGAGEHYLRLLEDHNMQREPPERILIFSPCMLPPTFRNDLCFAWHDIAHEVETGWCDIDHGYETRYD